MSSLNIDELYETIDSKKYRRFEVFDTILQKIHSRIKYVSRVEQTYCTYNIPRFIIGTPPYNFDNLKKYVIDSLKSNKFEVYFFEPNLLFISWDRKNQKKQTKVVKKKESGDFKLMEEYKPTGNFIFNDIELESLQDKTKQLSLS